jgi:hypothetical protein
MSSQPSASMITKFSRPYVSAFIQALGVTPYEAIPNPYLPLIEDGLGVPLVYTLSELAVLVPDLSAFQDRLVKARERRPIDPEENYMETYLQPFDVVMTTELMKKENEQIRSNRRTKDHVLLRRRSHPAPTISPPSHCARYQHGL